ncbi:MAG: cysteine hydrolase [Nitrososphaeraceae archaeon]|nr:cysteine hydrolase [Nitrososphaeraceae archaeon]MDW0177708.1 cysteine hydrolase [Nitrososphaeraceae archaeon]MDW0238796.1 cysteine hydrolase [Nitrososphaeraceae archaeon]MDW0269537.1 cysteine hydrolase [Nitrososphaeraceae archaeon]MDW0291647.1 cysteine hydrolase [Nitrososphaeraceae archaeon]
MKIKNHEINPALLVIDMQNGFVSKGGSYDLMGLNVSKYSDVVPSLKRLIAFCRQVKIPIFYSQAVREESGIDLLTRSHRILPKSREERIKRRPICIRGSWDAEIVEDLKPNFDDHVVIKRRDSVFQDTEVEVWLRSLGIDSIIFAGIDTSICVESSLRDAFNHGYDIILISDATSSNNLNHYNSTLDNIRNYYGLVMNLDEFIGTTGKDIK